MASRSIAQKLLQSNALNTSRAVANTSTLTCRRCLSTISQSPRQTDFTSQRSSASLESNRQFSTTSTTNAPKAKKEKPAAPTAAKKAKATSKTKDTVPVTKGIIPPETSTDSTTTTASVLESVAQPVLSSAAADVSTSSTIIHPSADSPLADAEVTKVMPSAQSSTSTHSQSFPTSARPPPPPAETSSSSSGSSAKKDTTLELAKELDPTAIKMKIKEAVYGVLPYSATESYRAYTATEQLYIECKAQADFTAGEELSEKAKFWFIECGLPQTFNTFVSITTLHMWMIMVRFRTLSDKEVDRNQTWQQAFINHFFWDLEDLLSKRYGVTMNSQRQKYLKIFNEQFRGAVAAYDEGLLRGDTTLATAFWRNVWDIKPEIDFEKLALVVSYTRRIIQGLEKVDDETILKVNIFFGNPTDEMPVVLEAAKEGRKMLNDLTIPVEEDEGEEEEQRKQ